MRRRSSPAASASRLARSKSSGRSETAAATPRAVAPICSAWDLRSVVSMNAMNCAASHGNASSTSATSSRRKRKPWKKPKRIAPSEVGVDGERAEAVRLALALELARLLHQRRGDREVLAGPRDAASGAHDCIAALERPTERAVRALQH